MRTLTHEDRDRIAMAAEDIAKSVLDDHNPKLSRTDELRFGTRGSLAVVTGGAKQGTWCDHQSGEGGDMIRLVMERLGYDFREAAEYCASYAGIRLDDERAPFAARRPQADEAERRRRDQERREAALAAEAEALDRRVGDGERIWNAAVPIAGTLAERHLLVHRRLTLEAVRPDWCRFHPRPGYTKDGEVKHLGPSMVCLLRDVVTAQPCGLRITALERDGAKAFRVAIGRSKRAAVMIDDDADVTTSLAVAEGVETALRLRQNGEGPIWALVNAGNLADFPVLPVIEALRIYGDNDRPDQRGRMAGQEAAEECAVRWQDDDREAVVFIPSEPGTDWDDVLRPAAPAEEAA